MLILPFESVHYKWFYFHLHSEPVEPETDDFSGQLEEADEEPETTEVPTKCVSSVQNFKVASVSKAALIHVWRPKMDQKTLTF